MTALVGRAANEALRRFRSGPGVRQPQDGLSFRPLLRLLAVAGLLAGLLAAAPAGWAETSGDSVEYEVRAAYLLNFARFVEWPAGAFEDHASPITLGIAGPTALDPQITREMEARVIQGRPIRVVRLDDAEAAAGCHIVFVPRSVADPRAVLAAIAGRPILTVGDGESFAARGGVIQLFVEDEVMRFEINRQAARRNHLTISSRLLALARLTPGGSDPRPETKP